ncbi:MAG TPA: hypothetical protein VFZ65_22425 [Planctomycetota bacterium]|nr:hypothetical protein [Planctomycetota bacterium]
MRSSPPPLLRPFAVAFAAHAAMALCYVLSRAPGTAAAGDGFPLDDAWIHMVYGRSLAARGVPAYNDLAEAGFTSPLWVMLLAVAHWCSAVLPAGPVFFAKLFGVLAASVTTASIYLLGLRLTSRSAVASFAALLCVLQPALAFAQVSGMEVSLTTANCALALLALADGRHRRAGVFLALAVWSRPECLLLAMLAPVVVAGQRGVPTAVRARQTLQVLAPTAVAVASWCGYCLIVTGHPLPNTVYAKFRMTGIGDGLRAMGEALGRLPSNLFAVGVLFAVLGVVRAPKTREPWLAGLIGVFPFAFLFAVVRSRPFPPDAGDFFYFARYPAPAWPFLLLATALGVHAVWQVAARQSRPAVRYGVRALTAAAVVLALIGHPQALARSIERFAWNCQNMNEVQVAFGDWVAANVPADRAVAINDAGAIRYFGGRRTIDLIGLNDQSVLFMEPPLAARCSTADAFADLLLARGADHLIIFRSWFPGLVEQPRFAARFAVAKVLVSPHYTVASPKSGQAEMVAYRVLPGDTARPPR